MLSISDRLKTARKHAGFTYASNAAVALGVPNSTYVGHESGERGMGINQAHQYAKFFKVDFSWLAIGKGPEPEGTVVDPEKIAG